MKESVIRNFLMIVSFLFLCTPLFAQPPNLLNYQGRLTDDGVPLDGERSITFSIYTTSIAGSALWTETITVTINDGVFNVLLGSNESFPADLFADNDELFLGIRVEDAEEMTPRFRIVSSVYALRASKADSVRDEAIVTSSLADGVVTTAKLAARPILVQETIGSFSNLQTAATEFGSVTINAGSSGRVLVIFSGVAIMFGDNTAATLGIGTSPESFDLGMQDPGVLDGSGTQRRRFPFTVIGTVEITEGTHTFFANGLKQTSFSAQTINLSQMRLVAQFIPD
jgi:hypothetical protein